MGFQLEIEMAKARTVVRVPSGSHLLDERANTVIVTGHFYGADLEVTIDIDELIRRLAIRAIESKGGRSVDAGGAVKVKHQR